MSAHGETFAREVSVVIAVRNGMPILPRCIDHLRQQTCPPLEIIVVDDGSSDDTPAFLEHLQSEAGRPAVIFLRNPGKGPSAARNVGIERARGELVAFTDADCLPAADWLQRLCETYALHAHEKTAGVGGGQISPPDECEFGRTVQVFLVAVGFLADYAREVASGSVREVPHNPSCNSLYRRDALLEEQGFLPGLFPGEDTDLDRRLAQQGWHLYFQPRALVAHYRPRDVTALRRMMRRYGWAQAVLVRLHGPFRLLHAVPAIMLAIIAFVLMGGARIPVRLLYVAGLSLLGACALFAARKVPVPAWPRFLWLLMITLYEWHRGFFAELLAPTGPRTGARNVETEIGNGT
ncbi:MAG: glycosyltransferase [Candidatus Schekmanbacteria bacterium]|nr:glycosyltransferase [Candidatus Schekmanbacteria bacterium]